MSILINRETKILVLGITGKSGSLQTSLMIQAGANIVGGVTPGKGGQVVCDLPVYDSVAQAREHLDFNAAISFVPPKMAKESCFEAFEAGIKLLVLTTEQILLQDVAEILACAKRHNATLVGPGCAGIIAPGVAKLGTHPAFFFKSGRVGVVSKSGALSYEIGKTLTDHGIGQSTVVAIGGGPLWGFSQGDAVDLFDKDPDTDAVVLLGEIGGSMEEEAAQRIAQGMSKPVFAMIVGRNAPKGKSLGHAGAIVNGKMGTSESKIEALERSGARVAKSPQELAQLVSDALSH